MKIFKNRQSAGKLLAKRLRGIQGIQGGIVLGIPRGGVVVAAEIAKELNLLLDTLVVRKIGAPMQEELAIGAVDPDGEVIWDDGLLKQLQFQISNLKFQIQESWKELKRREQEYRADRKPLELDNKIVILVDDGIATGATTLAAINYLKRHGAEKIILAVPVASREAIDKIIRELGEFGEVIVLETPEYFQAVGQFYQDFPQVSDEEVIQLLS